METVAYLQLTQDFENPESKELKVSGKAVMTAFTVVSTAWAGGLLTAVPVMATGYGCCRPVHRPVSCCRPVHRPVGCCRPVYRPVYYPVSSCQQSCYYPQTDYKHHDSGSYYPDYYSKDYSHDYSHDDSYETGYHDDYQEIAYHPVTNPNLLKLGSSGDAVALLQQTLLDLGYDVGAVDGLYGPSTKAAVIHYQTAAGLLVDGVAGGQTLDSLGLAGAGA